MANPNQDLLIIAAKRVEPLLEEFVFVGGCATGLLITDEGAGGVRPTVDVDVIVEVTSYAAYTMLGDRLRELGFTEDTSEGAPMCRWVHGLLKLDVMPLDEKILGFSNRWYKAAIQSAQSVELEKGLLIWVVTAPYFCATKLEAFKGRGKSDYLSSHDLEDVITVVDGRSELFEELRMGPSDVRSFVGGFIGQLLQSRKFIDAIPGYLLPDEASQTRIGEVMLALEQISNLS